MTTVVCCRHGETDWNRERRIQGWAAAPLNERGERQARALGRHLSATRSFDRLVASDLRRTRETTAQLRSAGQFPEPEFTRGWRERSFGIYQGLSYERVFGEYPEHTASAGMIGLESTPEEGESLLEARDRVIDAWEAVVRTAEPDDEVLVITHGGPIYVLLAAVRGLDLPAALTGFDQDNCAITELEYDQETGATEVRCENLTSYRDEQADRPG